MNYKIVYKLKHILLTIYLQLCHNVLTVIQYYIIIKKTMASRKDLKKGIIMNVLVACEESQRVTIEFRKLGHQAYSCDLLECSGNHPEWHIKKDVTLLLNGNCIFHTVDGVEHEISGKWDMIIAFPPCTYLTVTGNRWFNYEKYGNKAIQRMLDRNDAIKFFMTIANADCDKIAIENPVGIMSTKWRKPDQIIQPFEFGDAYEKRTCLWLKGLQKLIPTKIVDIPDRVKFKSGKTMAKWYDEAAHLSKEQRALVRSKTFPGIAKAMATQWGSVEKHYYDYTPDDFIKAGIAKECTDCPDFCEENCIENAECSSGYDVFDGCKTVKEQQYFDTDSLQPNKEIIEKIENINHCPNQNTCCIVSPFVHCNYNYKSDSCIKAHKNFIHDCEQVHKQMKEKHNPEWHHVSLATLANIDNNMLDDKRRLYLTVWGELNKTLKNLHKCNSGLSYERALSPLRRWILELYHNKKITGNFKRYVYIKISMCNVECGVWSSAVEVATGQHESRKYNKPTLRY